MINDDVILMYEYFQEMLQLNIGHVHAKIAGLLLLTAAVLLFLDGVGHKRAQHH